MLARLQTQRPTQRSADFLDGYSPYRRICVKYLGKSSDMNEKYMDKIPKTSIYFPPADHSGFYRRLSESR
jgi:hypothetical protein